MAKKLLPKNNNYEPDKIHIHVERWAWKTTSSHWTWKHWVGLILLIVAAVLFALGFLIIASVLVVTAIILHIITFLLKKLS